MHSEGLVPSDRMWQKCGRDRRHRGMKLVVGRRSTDQMNRSTAQCCRVKQSANRGGYFSSARTPGGVDRDWTRTHPAQEFLEFFLGPLSQIFWEIKIGLLASLEGDPAALR